MTVRWNTELVALKQEINHVKATFKQPDGTVLREITAAWVAGCDGARSAVREMNAIEFVGAPYEHVFFVADTEVTGPMVPDELNVYLWRDGFHLFFPMRGIRSLASRRYPAVAAARQRRSDFRGRDPVGATGSGCESDVQGVQLVLDVSHSSSVCRALS